MPTESPTADEALKAKLTDYLGHLESAARQGGDFVAQQMPDVVHQMVVFNLAQAVFWTVVGVGLIVLAQWLGRLVWRNGEAIEGATHSEGVVGVFAFLGSLGVGFGGLALFLVNSQIILKCVFAPKLFVLEQIIALVK